MKRIIIILLSAIITFTSCELFEEASDGLSTEEVVDGLKTALKVGADTATTVLNQVDGYLKDEAVKILLPEEAQVIYEIRDNPLTADIYEAAIAPFVDNVILTMNKAAENAANEAKPILKNTITGMSINDAWDILNGTNPADMSKAAGFDSTAATNYLVSTTSEQLVVAYKDDIDQALGQDIIGNISAYDAWNTFKNSYNSIADNILYNSALTVAGIQLTPIEKELDQHVTEYALKGLFHKVGEEEVKIRRDPWEWASTLVGDILTKVFGDE